MVSTDVSFLPWYGNSSFLPPGTVPAPVISPESSSFRVSVDVTIGDSVSGSTVHYTTDGTTPTCSSDTYTDGQVLHFSQPVTVNAIRCDSGGAAVPSAVSSATYTIANSGGGGGGTATAATVAQAATTPAATQTATTPAVTTPAGQVLGAEAFNFTGDLHMSSSGSDVTELQKVLIAAGFDIPAITKGGIAYGYFGGQTLAAVIAYQKANGVTSTGYVGTLTRAVLNKGATPSTGTAATSAAGTKPMFTKALTVGVRDADVTALQQYLTDNGFYSGPVTGYFGTLTKAAVQIYQKEKGIAQTGVVGPLTRAELNKGKVTTTNSAAGSTVLTGSATTTPASGMSAY
ncbi:MAG: hypothetical protein UY93_C0002G0138 [Parcubacteria group bacterium GW2011_GWA1_56_13]|nr:MAG: hypothetical protein UY93_C0002G0138 [Parcubacteria group bacterium GW2011_GWA1_56_13]